MEVEPSASGRSGRINWLLLLTSSVDRFSWCWLTSSGKYWKRRHFISTLPVLIVLHYCRELLVAMNSFKIGSNLLKVCINSVISWILIPITQSFWSTKDQIKKEFILWINLTLPCTPLKSQKNKIPSDFKLWATFEKWFLFKPSKYSWVFWNIWIKISTMTFSLTASSFCVPSDCSRLNNHRICWKIWQFMVEVHSYNEQTISIWIFFKKQE